MGCRPGGISFDVEWTYGMEGGLPFYEVPCLWSLLIALQLIESHVGQLRKRSWLYVMLGLPGYIYTFCATSPMLWTSLALQKKADAAAIEP